MLVKKTAAIAIPVLTLLGAAVLTACQLASVTGSGTLETLEMEFEYDEDGVFEKATAEFKTVTGEALGLVLPPFEREE